MAWSLTGVTAPEIQQNNSTKHSMPLYKAILWTRALC